MSAEHMLIESTSQSEIENKADEYAKADWKAVNLATACNRGNTLIYTILLRRDTTESKG